MCATFNSKMASPILTNHIYSYLFSHIQPQADDADTNFLSATAAAVGGNSGDGLSVSTGEVVGARADGRGLPLPDEVSRIYPFIMIRE